MICFFLSIFLPFINRENCNRTGIGYTCQDLEEGVEKLQILLKRKRNYTISYSTYSNFHPNQALLRLYSVMIALATDSIPIMYSQSMEKTKMVRDPSISIRVKKLNHAVSFPLCFNETQLQANVSFAAEMPPILKPLLLNPAIYRLTEYLGPAAYHILLHYTLNISEEIFMKKIQIHSNNEFVSFSIPRHISCVNSNMYKMKVLTDPSIKDVIEALNAQHFGYQIGNPAGWLITVLRGIPSYIFDPVSQNCFYGSSIMSGGLNPLYSGIFGDTADFSRGGDFCGNPKITQNLLKLLL
ncbi:hypothetical protein TRFO_13537 [Tritrichomonas foetus]|uniref:Uncharacterized protein n=1 Tax=Tritrichomonas foetus TaxID=1144522 RepID=A0A1J4L250_9EUKA|nr:hypothetical protein TRFO_13537 [Tritrichomonas foetus]|eukprot:OHT16044.1 hypothetical protein TRFO_13537 [Tritrichomonas foetus]